MKRLLPTMLTFLFALTLAANLEAVAGELNKEGGMASSRVGVQPGGQMSQTGGAAGENPMSNETGPDKKDLQGQLDVVAGQKFNITLASNPTTGYHWELAAPLDEAVVKLVTSEYKQPETRMLGAGGQEIWTFWAVGRGLTVVSLKYVRPWEKDVAPERTASYAVTVR